MLIPDKYVPARRLFNLTNSFIRRKLERHIDECDHLKDKPQFPNFRARVAAAQLCRLLHQKFPTGLYRAYSPGVVPVPLDRLDYERVSRSRSATPRFFFEWEEKSENRIRLVKRSWRETVESDFWIVSILAWDIPDVLDVPATSISQMMGETPIVRLESGTIDLNELRDSIKTARAGARFERARQKQDIVVPAVMAGYLAYCQAEIANLESCLTALEPFEPFPMVIQRGHFEEIREVYQASEKNLPDEREEMQSPVEQILEITRSNPTLKKKGIFELMGGSNRMSFRRFLLYWASAAEENPTLSKAGRKPRNRSR